MKTAEKTAAAKTMLIIGASSGIGEALAYEAAKANYNLVLCARRKDNLLKIKEKINSANPAVNVLVDELDVTEDVGAIFFKMQLWHDEMDGINSIVLNAGVEQVGKLGMLDVSKETQMIDINFAGVVRCTDAAVKLFLDAKNAQSSSHTNKNHTHTDSSKKNSTNKNSSILSKAVSMADKAMPSVITQGVEKAAMLSNSLGYKVFNQQTNPVGHIIVTSSASAYVPLASNPVYAATKAAVTHFMEGLRGRLAKRGIAVTLVHPGFIKTPMTSGLEKRVPSRLIADVDETARAMLVAIEAKKDNLIVPEQPWTFVKQAHQYLPDRITRLFPS